MSVGLTECMSLGMDDAFNDGESEYVTVGLSECIILGRVDDVNDGVLE